MKRNYIIEEKGVVGWSEIANFCKRDTAELNYREYLGIARPGTMLRLVECTYKVLDCQRSEL